MHIYIYLHIIKGAPGEDYYIARVTRLYERHKDGAKMALCQWFYRAKETVLGQSKGGREVNEVCMRACVCMWMWGVYVCVSYKVCMYVGCEVCMYVCVYYGRNVYEVCICVHVCVKCMRMWI